MANLFSIADMDIVMRLALALFLGGAIGFERRWRGHAAGPHTNGLVAMGAALFMVLAISLGNEGLGRMAAQIATGIGFLAGGVILRDGLRVRGLNTAATVWCVAAIGSIAGYGRYDIAIGATLLIVIANSIFHYLEHNVGRLKNIRESEEHPRRQRQSSDST